LRRIVPLLEKCRQFSWNSCAKGEFTAEKGALPEWLSLMTTFEDIDATAVGMSEFREYWKSIHS
jgi:hypothetical protein